MRQTLAEFPFDTDFRQHFRHVGKHWVFICRECGTLTRGVAGKRVYAAHEVALCGSECLTRRVGRITCPDYVGE